MCSFLHVHVSIFMMSYRTHEDLNLCTFGIWKKKLFFCSLLAQKCDDRISKCSKKNLLAIENIQKRHASWSESFAFAVFLTLSKCKHLANLEPAKCSQRLFTVVLKKWNEFSNKRGKKAVPKRKERERVRQKNGKIKLSEHVCLFYACLWVYLE